MAKITIYGRYRGLNVTEEEKKQTRKWLSIQIV